jgi:hypothetical protein
MVARWLSCACLGLALVAGGCTDRLVDVQVNQPIEFPHQSHLTYFSSGQHRTEKIRMHLDIFDQKEPPAELAEGRCVECHDDLAERAACASCHVPFQNAALRSRREVRPCVGCHRGAWGAAAATIPSAETCLACHEAGVRLAQSGAKGPSFKLVRTGSAPVANAAVEDVPWVRINTLAPNVYFSHTPHVRYASMACTQCHQDVRTLASPPTSVRVFAMSDCLNCHVTQGASTDCLTCHK